MVCPKVEALSLGGVTCALLAGCVVESKPGKIVGQHDLSYRLFFAHRRMIQDLLREIVGERWVERIDLGSGERVDASFVSRS
jgi:hypothetical protein